MNTIIYYFTGTGNSLQVALELSKELTDTSIIQISESTKLDVSAERIGFIFPVHLWGVPAIVEKFLMQLPSDLTTKYLFAVATYKSQTANVIGQVNNLLKKSQNQLSSGFTIEMPGNNIIYYDVDSENIQNEKISNCLIKINEIAEIINSEQKEIPKVSALQSVLFTGFLHKTLTRTFKGSDKNFWTTENCTHCGICTRVCPVGNISFKDGKPVWNHNCQQCVACINSCPNHAIQFGKTTTDKKRYVNKQIGVEGLQNKNALQNNK